ncbi:MAG: hypothetical protein ACRDXF_02775 [Acidimicrobiia bacterium]
MALTDHRSDTIDWLLDSDPSIRWQVMRDLTDERVDVVAAERSRVATEGWGARLLALQGSNGQWAGGTYQPEWTSTTNTLALLRVMGLDPASDEARRAVTPVREEVFWNDHPDAPWAENPYFAGEVEPCINGRVVAVGSYFGQDVQGLVDRLLGEQLADGGWNCEAENGSTRSSFDTTINVLEGLLEHERATGAADVTQARVRGQEYLLERRMFHRLSTGEVVDPAWTYFFFPTRWHYDVLRGLDYLRSAGVEPDERWAEAIELVEKRRGEDGRWTMHYSYPGEVHFDMDEGEGRPSRWITLGALRVLAWSSGHSTVK